jgi:hypothetical protein
LPRSELEFDRSKFMTTIEFENVHGERELMIYDAAGRIVRIIPVNDGVRRIALKRVGLRGGLYYFNLFSGDELVLKGRFTIE